MVKRLWKYLMALSKDLKGFLNKQRDDTMSVAGETQCGKVIL